MNITYLIFLSLNFFLHFLKDISFLCYRLVPKPNCIKVPKEICVNTKHNPRRVKKPVVKEWCYRPSDLLDNSPSISHQTPDVSGNGDASRLFARKNKFFNFQICTLAEITTEKIDSIQNVMLKTTYNNTTVDNCHNFCHT